MAKKKFDYRAHAAHQRNQQKIADAKAKQKEKEFIQKYGLKILIGVVALIVAIVAISLTVSFFRGPGGSIPQWFGTLRNVEEDWIIANTGTTSKPKYFKLAEYTAPEGYTLDPDYGSYTEELVQTQYYDANDDAAVVDAVYVAGVKNTSAADQLAAVMTYYPENAGAKQATIAGHDVHYTYITQDTTPAQTDEEGNAIEVPEEEHVGTSMLVMYEDSVQNSCVLLMLQTDVGPKADIVAEDVLVAEAEKFLPLLTVEK
ncbi:MAG: hypothetical protein IKB78_02760 [Clostridia bacterium]|nr:hypothetical protein [Clostridia bacterium]